MTDAAVHHVRALLSDRAFLSADADAYMAGVDDALRTRVQRPEPARARPDGESSVRPWLDGRGVE